MRENRNRNFVMERAGEVDLGELVEIMEDAADHVQKKEWFAAGDRAYLKDILIRSGFIILAREKETQEAAGFFAVVFPTAGEEYMAQYTALSREERRHVVYMDTAAVKQKFCGNRLQKQMLDFVEQELQKREDYEKLYRLCTIHPENRFSRRNMENAGYEILAKAALYGGLPRLILGKRTKKENQIKGD